MHDDANAAPGASGALGGCPGDVRALAAAVTAGLDDGQVVPYLGPGMLSLCRDPQVPANPAALATLLTARVGVPHRIRGRLTQAAQFIENFKHRKTLVALMNDALTAAPEPSPLHVLLARSKVPLLVDAWYDGTLGRALRTQLADPAWGRVQGLSQSQHFGRWNAAYAGDGTELVGWNTGDAVPADWSTLLYQPLGGREPSANYLVSDSDFVEVLTEIDIQTPIPRAVQELRRDRRFLFLGCRFDDQLARSFARQIMKRSGTGHLAVIAGPLTRMERRFMHEQGIEHVDLELAAFAAALGASSGDASA